MERLWRAYSKLAAGVAGAAAVPEEYSPAVVKEVSRSLAQDAARQRALSQLAQSLARGEDLVAALVATLRPLLHLLQRHTARAVSLGLSARHGSGEVADLGLGLVLHQLAHFELAAEHLLRVDVDLLTEHVPVEAVQCLLADGRPAALDVAAAVVADPARLATADLVGLGGRFLVVGDRHRARVLLDEVTSRPAEDLDDHLTKAVANLRGWTREVAPAALPAGTVSIGVIDYDQPDFDRSSRNVGDYVQTLAMLGGLARFQQVRFGGEHGLGELMAELQARVRPELRLDSPAADVRLMPVSRDFSSGEPVPPSTWMVAFGWHLHSAFRLRFGLPYHQNINPVFVSFHVNRPAALTPEALDYLRRHGPVGCRDHTTVDLLLSAGVDAFFTGCLTTTVDAVFPPRTEVDRDDPGVVAVIDLPRSVVRKPRRPVVWLTHGGDEFRDMDLVSGVHEALDLLGTYQTRFHRVVTGRLHSYLPATSLGVPVSFRPKNPGDIRFDGLTGLTPDSPAFEAIRDEIRSLLAGTFRLVLEGAPREEVYEHWRHVTAGHVERARRRHRTPVQMRVEVDVPDVVRQIQAGMRSHGPREQPTGCTDVALSLDANFAALLPVTLESLVTNASGPLRLWITARGLDAPYERWLSAAFPATPMTFLEFDHVEYGVLTRMIRHISIACMDRLLLAEALPHLDRLVYVDIDTVTEGDVCELGRIRLDGRSLAARSTFQTGTRQWRAAGDHLSAADASDLRRTMTARHPFDFTTFNAGVLVLDLARLRADRFAETFLPMAGQWGLNDQDLLNAYTGADRVELEPRWNALPVLEEVGTGGIVHYAGAGKPWGDELVPYGERWRLWAARFAARVGPILTAPPR